jgi:hypothetical protein
VAEEARVDEPEVKWPRARAFARAHAVTGAAWAVGIGLQLAASLLRDRVSLSDDLFLTSMIAPAWTFLQVCLLAGVLRLMRRRAEPWRTRSRVVFGIGAAAACMLLQPGVLLLLLSGPAAFNPADTVALALLWSTPLALYLAPAAIVVWAWVRRDGRVSLPRALGYGLVAQGVLNFAFILWLNHLWAVYVNIRQPAGP